MDAAQDTSVLAPSALPPKGGAAVGIGGREVNKTNKQSFNDVFEGEVSGSDLAAEVDDTVATAPGSALQANSVENLGAAVDGSAEDAELAAQTEESGEALPLNGETSIGQSQARNTPEGLPGVKLIAEHAIASGQTAINLENTSEAKALAETLNVNKGKPGQSDVTVTTSLTAERSQSQVLPKPDDNGWFFRQQEATRAVAVNKTEFAAELKADGDLRNPTEMLSGRVQDQQAGLQTLLNASSTAAKAPPLTINTPMQADSAWADAFSEKISWLLGKGEQSATIHLAPQELGKMQLRITMNQGGTQIEVHARNPVTAELMESMLPKLQASLESQGIRLDEVKFSQVPLDTDREFSKQFAQQGNTHSASQQGDEEGEGGAANSGGDDVTVLQSGLLLPVAVDYYA
ncbi:MAG: flagellar hook-length control protein FliK [Bermanella sp.]|jgi:flagellar hook-length control protein FliK